MGMYMAIKLHCFGESGNAYKAALTLELAGINWSPVYVDFFGGAARSDGYRDLNIMAEAPILVQGDFSLSQSGAIQQWVVDQTGNLGGSPEDKYEVLRWVLFDNHKMSSQAGMTRFLMNFLPEDKRPLEVIKFMQGRVLGALKILDTHLESRSWIVGNTMTIADIANCGYLFYPEPYGFTRANWSNIDSWLSRVEATKGWKHPYDLMPRNPSDRV
jgi:glutathione S-transferase